MYKAWWTQQFQCLNKQVGAYYVKSAFALWAVTEKCAGNMLKYRPNWRELLGGLF
jgi:hypothetical protein